MLNSKLKILLILLIFFGPIILNVVNADQGVTYAASSLSKNRVVAAEANLNNRATAISAADLEAAGRVLRQLGAIYATSDPNGAEVLVDGSSKGTAPLNITKLKTGRHDVEYRLTGYQNQSVMVTVNGGATTPVKVILIPLSHPPGVETASSLPVSWIVLVAILLVLILAGAGVFLWTRNNLQVLPKDKSLPGDGKSTLPIKVQFVNGFGKLKTQGSDREVQMEATSGKIDKAVVPAGKSSAEVQLASSNECGPVTVTARSDGQEVKVPIEFAANEVGLDLEIDKAEIPADGKSQSTVSIMVKCAEGVHIMSQTERTIILETTHGEITSPVKIPPRTLVGTATLTAGDRSGTATVTATSGQLKGEAKIIFAETEKRHCMWCGTPMEMEVDKCPKCGKIPPSGVDTMQCGACNSVLPLSAKFCDKCGAKQSQ